MDQAVMLQGVVGLDLAASGTLRRNLASPALVQMAVRDGEGSLVAEGALATTTGPHTGRSPKDRFIVDHPRTSAAIDWGEVNQQFDATQLDRL